ncbi:cytochrome c3 family protein [Shewanella sp. UCD-KL12]|uniref:multiheme c-type cytochrome n=1 Tax=Shewanella sp. UCD-KL12 TaxID=1917163 RepID=UPI0009708E09|nr:cytochrome c3 family protein [Shewanella sp. UCD-KL12]
MKEFNKRYLALVVAGVVGLSACGSDGKDGSDGEDGKPTPPPSVETSTVTNVEMISHALEDGQVRFEFEITDEDNNLISGLEKANAEVAELTEGGIGRSRDDFEGTILGGSASESTEGAELTEIETGRYEFVAPMASVTAGTEGLIRLAVGGGDNIAKSRYIVVDKSENLHTTSTATCHACHTDYAASSLKHPSYTAINPEGETDLVAGCMTCHGNIARDDGGYARNTMQKIGHINHQKFEKDFAPSNCYTCHEKPIETVYSQQTCIDCHDAANIQTSDLATAFNAFSDGTDMRLFHKQVSDRAELREVHYTTTSAPYLNDSLEWEDYPNGGWCTDVALFNTEGDTEVQLNIAALYADGTLTYAGAYVHGYQNDSLVGRPSPRGSEQYIENVSGSRSICYPHLDGLDSDYRLAGLTASTRVTFKQQDEDGGYDGVSLTSYSDVVDHSGIKLQEFDRRHSVTADSCTTCHTNETNYHKNGSYNEGGLDCVACHNNGQDRSAKNSAPGFGPMVHSMHWGVGNTATDPDGEENSAAKLNAENCVACHAEGIDLNAIPNQYILSKAYNGGTSGVMTSPITANCFACHNDDSAKNHMLQQGGEINAEKLEDWYTLPTSESCATCHAEGKSYGIDKFHVFDRAL